VIAPIGLGGWPLDDNAARVIVAAIEAGRRHIDTAARCGNERGVGQGIRASGIRRGNLFVTTKLDGTYQGNDRAINGLNESLRRLGLDTERYPDPRRTTARYAFLARASALFGRIA